MFTNFNDNVRAVNKKRKYICNFRYILAALALVFLSTAPANATTYRYFANYANNGVSSAIFTYSDTSERLSVFFNADPAGATSGGQWNGQPIDGFWLVLSNGANPQVGAVNDSAILYADLTNNILSAFVYTNIDSYKTPLIQRFDGVLDVVRNGSAASVFFDIDASYINAYSSALTSADWRGVAFDEQIGTWLHPSFASNMTYDSNGVLNNFAWSGWIGGDENFRNTVPFQDVSTGEIPEPASVALLLSGLGFARLRRKKA